MRILLVEDHLDTARVLRRLLNGSAGHDVSLAASVAQAVALCQHERFDLLICDLSLPDGDGWQLLQHLRTLCSTPAIALSAHAYEADRQRSGEVGFAAHLAKPVHIDELLATIESVSAQAAPPAS